MACGLQRPCHLCLPVGRLPGMTISFSVDQDQVIAAFLVTMDDLTCPKSLVGLLLGASGN